eukprot:TRINITY_DN79151_c0_g1_i1.p2 TRINITY_DN79151_c0_g1~~TRINITY_DN79151_c0_g1_i1.p2  ORF type:complete len:134 (-),score=38.51 TRINITY_DN79151_c0_g1_i1:116-517(-)
MEAIWAVRCIDDESMDFISPPAGAPQPPPGAPGLCREGRIAHTIEHKEYQAEVAAKEAELGLRKIASGPLVSDDGERVTGSQFLLQGTRKAVDTFVESDPFFRNKVWTTVTIDRYMPFAGVKAVEPLLKPRDN